MKNIKKTKKILLMFTIIFTLSTTFCALYYSMDPKLTSMRFQTISEKENMKTDPIIKPQSSTDSINITKTANILDGNAFDVKIVGSYAYVANFDDGLEIIDISDPAAPTEVGQFDDGGKAYEVYVSGSYAYVAEFVDGLEIIDISNPTAPEEAGQIYDGGEAWGVYVSGSYAYVADNADGLEIIDISDPTSPEEVGQFYDGGYATGIYISGSYAYLADGPDGLEIIDISDPTAPVEVGQFNDSEEEAAISVYVSGSYAYVTDYGEGLKIIDISDPTTPVEVGQIYDGGEAWDVYVSGSYAYLADGPDGLEIIDIFDPTTPVEVAQFYDGGAAYGVFVSGSYAYVADGSDGLEILYVTGVERILTISSPLSSSSWEIGSLNNIYWESIGYISTVNLELFRDGVFEKLIASDVSNEGSYYWILPSDLHDSVSYQIKITDASDSSIYDFSDYFEIFHNTLTVDNPSKNSSWEIDHSYYIIWSTTGSISDVKIELYNNDIITMIISSETPNEDCQYKWMIPADLDSSQNYQIKIIDTNDDSVYGISEYFEIFDPDSSSISGYNPGLLLIAMGGISVILLHKKRKK